MGLVLALLVGLLVAAALRWLLHALGSLLLASGQHDAAWLAHHTVVEPVAIGAGLVAAALAGFVMPMALLLLRGVVVVAMLAAGVHVAAALVRWRRSRP